MEYSMELSKNLHESFTDYLINLLKKRNILTAVDFVKKDTYTLSQITNLDVEKLTELKNDLFGLLKPYEGLGFTAQILKTGINSFDEMLGGGLKSGHLYDICGLSASGKTQICNTIAVNLAWNHKYETLYIDAKKDFSGQRIYNMLNARNCSDIECGSIMNCIRCWSIYDVPEFLTILRELPSYLKNNKRTKCLIVDSLPALWFQLLDGKNNGVSLLCEATNLMQKIAFTFDVVILLVNIVTRRTEKVSDTSKKSDRLKTKITVALGKYWQTVPRQRFLLTRTNVSDSQLTGQRTVEIIHHEGKGKTCTVNITNKGVL